MSCNITLKHYTPINRERGIHAPCTTIPGRAHDKDKTTSNSSLARPSQTETRQSSADCPATPGTTTQKVLIPPSNSRSAWHFTLALVLAQTAATNPSTTTKNCSPQIYDEKTTPILVQEMLWYLWTMQDIGRRAHRPPKFKTLGRRPWLGLHAPGVSTLVLVGGSCAPLPDTCDDDDDDDDDDDNGRTTPVVELIEPPDPDDDFQPFSIDLRMLGLDTSTGAGHGTIGQPKCGCLGRSIR